MKTKDQSRHDNLIIKQFTEQAEPFARIPGHSADEATRLLIELAKVNKEDTVLDVACGPGLLACALAPYAKHVTGIDIVPKMIDLAQKAQKDKGLTNVSWQTGNAMPLPYNNVEFSVVVSRYTFHHFLEPQAVLKEMIRVTKPKGRVAVIDVFAACEEISAAYDSIERLRDPSHVHTWPLAQLQGMAVKAGLTNMQVKFYKVEIPLEDQLKASFPKEKSDIDKIRQAAREDVGKNKLGWGAHYKGQDIHIALPIAVMVGKKG